jgi:hypothetical protein
MTEKIKAIIFEAFGERIVDRRYLGNGDYEARRGWRLIFRRKVYYHWFEDFN